jgi:hypothetical protein
LDEAESRSNLAIFSMSGDETIFAFIPLL